MNDWRPTRLEWLLLAGCGLLWIAVLAILPPNAGATDVYLFRDPAFNLLTGHGFRTASFEHSHSFIPLLYSSYTPGTQWAFAGVAKLLGTGALTARVYPCIWAAIADVVALFAGLRFLAVRWQRWVFLALIGLVMPFGVMGPMGERPEAVSFAVLVLLVLAMRRRPGSGSAALAGLLGGAAFLCEPFAGVVAVVLIAGWLFCAGLFGETTTKPGGFAAQSAIAALTFLFPIAITAGAFYQEDPQSLQRFWQQATLAGVGRQVNYSGGEATVSKSGIGATTSAAGASGRQSLFQKYRDALSFHRALGPTHLFGFAGAGVFGLAWVAILVKAKGPWQGVFALMLAGFACFVFPFMVFPLQGNYLALTGALFPVLLAANWASVRRSLLSAAIIPALLAVSAVSELPASGLVMLMGWESRASYSLAQLQVEQLRGHLKEHPLNGKVALVPPGQYYLYKGAAGNIYNPAYLSYQEDPAQVGAVVNCYRSTGNFQPGTLPLPEFVADRSWERISTAQDTVTVSLFGHRLMSKNWGMGCDIYVEPTG